MCGIAGIFHYAEPGHPVDVQALERMTRALAHRGPDAEAFHVSGPLGFGHRRLSIVDLTPTGAQPMATGEGRFWITYNGELYNHRDFRPRLEARGVRFRGTSDTETLLHLLALEGVDALAEAAGIFAFAFYDATERRLLLARDPLGVKQVYFHDDGRRVAFASELKALILCPGVPRALDPEGLNQYLHFHTPLFERTFFRDVRVLRPGQAISFDARGSRRQTFWALQDFSTRSEPAERLVEELGALLGQVVGDQLMSDVPVGAFFSGGIDSSVVAAHARRAGANPPLFGVHFAGQAVIDEEPYQRLAAKALGLELELISMDGGDFPERFLRLMYAQDQPVIGPALLPMDAVSGLAASRVKVCLGGQAGDEIFGGYARYALAHPLGVLARLGRGRASQAEGQAAVGGNLLKQLVDCRNLRRLVRVARNLGSHRARYFEHFATVSEHQWHKLFADPGLVSRAEARAVFEATLDRCPAQDPADELLHWDLQTYLPGLFQQDDRMSMAHSLESRVPLADPRLVRFAFRVPFSLKMRSGATKWLLRQAVAGILPAEVLNRRKVGFDTPAEAWLRGPQRGFARELLLSRAARERGLWNPRAVEALLADDRRHLWFDALWKCMCVEAWCCIFLDGQGLARPVPAEAAEVRVDESSGDEGALPISERGRRAAQELRELGAGRVLFRARWELEVRSGLKDWLHPKSLDEGPTAYSIPPAAEWGGRILFSEPEAVAAALAGRIPEDRLAALEEQAARSLRGRLLCFGCWEADFGQPPDFHLNPLTGRRWEPAAPWSRALGRALVVGDVKLTWELGRFPHAYLLTRAAAFRPARAASFAAGLLAQVRVFAAANPYGLGVHWYSGQEIVFRQLAYLFAFRGLVGRMPPLALAFAELLGRQAILGAGHIEKHIDYARKAVYNNHLLSEALGLLLVGTLFPDLPEAGRWRNLGREIIEGQIPRQLYHDGGYIQQSHNYERLALQVLLVARQLLVAAGAEPLAGLDDALDRSVDFLAAFQNPADGRLPNYGSNDGALPLVLSTCDFSDFRPTLQAASLAARGERLYPEGPWDEEAAWLLGPETLEAPLGEPRAVSRTFDFSGQHVLRGSEPGSFGAFRCGTLRDRFSQIDMLHLDVWWRGVNVLVDGGSYLYNGPAKWHDYFVRTASHNTLSVDGQEQMVHHRRFKVLYWTRAERLAFRDNPAFALVAGEHLGFQRRLGCVHRRSVLFLKDDLWIVADTLVGTGEHSARLHWLGAPGPHVALPGGAGMRLDTLAGPFFLRAFGLDAEPLAGDVVAGREEPPRGWLSRYYGEKVSAPSYAVEQKVTLPWTCLSILGGAEDPVLHKTGKRFQVSFGPRRLAFHLKEGSFEGVEVS